MKGDFTRNTFEQGNHFSRVLMQQGRVTVDADHNEQTSILLHYLRTLARDLIGPYAAPIENAGFAIAFPPPSVGGPKNGFSISPGRYYVDGILVENDSECFYLMQPDYPVPSTDSLLAAINTPPAGNPMWWAYLDVWERHITYLEDDSIREVALNGADTCTRAQVVWQVKALPFTPQASLPEPAPATCETPLGQLVTTSNAFMAAQLNPGRQIADPCVQSPSSKYRGAENQLYRVEIHQGGAVGQATFKWSRDNGSIATAWIGTSGTDLQVGTSRGFDAGVWVELSDDVSDLQGVPGTLVQLLKVGNGTLSFDPGTAPAAGIPSVTTLVNPKVRRWDQTQTGSIALNAGAVPVQETSPASPVWIDLEDGIQVQFSAGGSYRTGDYWQIPARVATGNIEWPMNTDASGVSTPDALPPDGIEHHYAPLGFVGWNGQAFSPTSCGCTFSPLSSCMQGANAGTRVLDPSILLKRTVKNVSAARTHAPKSSNP